MKKYSFLIIVFILFSISSSNAQVKFVLNGGAAIPTGDFSNLVKAGFGTNLGMEFTLSSSTTSSTVFTLNAGYNIYSSDNFITTDYFITNAALLPSSHPGPSPHGNPSISTLTFHTISILGGAKYFFEKIYYLGGALGYGSLDAGDEKVGGIRFIFKTESAFLWSPTFGVRLNNWDINANYNSMSKNGGTISWFGVNVGYVFGN